MSRPGIRIAIAALTMSAGGFATWQAREGFTAQAVIPTKGDVPTLGHGSTHYGDGRKVKMGDTITRPAAAVLARKLMAEDERQFRKTLPATTTLTQGEYDAYLDFIGQYGIGNWAGSSMRRQVIAGNYVKACQALLNYRYAAGYDCSTLVNGKPNKRCYGVWTRQVARQATCSAEL